MFLRKKAILEFITFKQLFRTCWCLNDICMCCFSEKWELFSGWRFYSRSELKETKQSIAFLHGVVWKSNLIISSECIIFTLSLLSFVHLICVIFTRKANTNSLFYCFMIKRQHRSIRLDCSMNDQEIGLLITIGLMIHLKLASISVNC